MAAPRQNQLPAGWITKIKDPDIRSALLQVYGQLGQIQDTLAKIGQLTRPLIGDLNAANFQLKRLQDPTDPQDAVTLRYLQSYVANFASQFSGDQAGAGGGTGGGGGTPPIDDGIPDHLDVVTDTWNLAPLGPSSSDLDLYRFVRAVAVALETVDAGPPVGRTCGLLHKPSGANIYTCSGETYSISRVCYDNGHVFKIVIDADPGGSRLPGWASNPPLLLDDYRAVAGAGVC